MELQTRLGGGAYGDVWAGRWRRQEVAVKMMHRSGNTDNEILYKEMSLLAELRNENIVRFLGASLEPSSMAIIFELCPGSLFDLLHKSSESLPAPTHMLTMMHEVALGMNYLHTCEPPVLHLDLKSANVLLDYNGVAKVCDFGMSETLETGAAAVEACTSIGSPQWTAPEMLRGDSFGRPADCFSYGVLLYEVMARRLPYDTTDSCELVMGVVTMKMPRPSLEKDEASPWPPALPTLMEHCMLENPSCRPEFGAILDAIEGIRGPRENRGTIRDGIQLHQARSRS